PCGNATGNAKCSDMRGTNHSTTYSYTDSPVGGNGAGDSEAYLTSVTYPNGTGKSYTYNYASGTLSSTLDENTQTTSFKYNDSMNRLTETDFADGGVEMINYSDGPSSASITTCKLLTTAATGGSCPISGAGSGTWTSSTMTRDGMGHVVNSQLATD